MSSNFDLFNDETMARLRRKPVLVDYCCTLLQNEGFRTLCARIADDGLFNSDAVIPDMGFSGNASVQKGNAKKLIRQLKLPFYDLSSEELVDLQFHDGQEIFNPMGRQQLCQGGRSYLMEPLHLINAFLSSRNDKATKIGLGLSVMFSFVQEEISRAKVEEILALNDQLQERISQVSKLFIWRLKYLSLKGQLFQCMGCFNRLMLK